MVVTQCTRWMCAIAGSSVVLGFFNYFQSEKKVAKNASTSDFEPSTKWDFNWDNRDITSRSKQSIKEKDENNNNSNTKAVATARRNIFLIRHGEYNLKGKTDAERALTELGRKQAELVGQRLKDLKFNYTLHIRSTMTRAVETSDAIHKVFPNLPIESCDLLREGAPIPPDPSTITFNVDEETYARDGIRIEKAFRKYFHRADVSQEKDSYEIMVCHGNVIRYFVCRLLQFPPQAWIRFQLHHCSITRVLILPNGRVVVYYLGDAGFFSHEELSD